MTKLMAWYSLPSLLNRVIKDPSRADLVKELLDTLNVIKPNEPDKITGLVPCGCGGRATLCLSFGTHDDVVGSQSFELNAECHECYVSTSVCHGVIEDGWDIKAYESMVISDWNKAMGYKEE